MKRDFSAVLTFAGKPVKEQDAELNLGGVAVSALLLLRQDESNISGEDKFKRYKLAERLTSGGVIDVSVEELALLKKLIGAMYQPIVVGAAFDLLERDPLAAAQPDEPAQDVAAAA